MATRRLTREPNAFAAHVEGWPAVLHESLVAAVARAEGSKVAIGGHRVCGLVVERAAGWRVAIGGHRVCGLVVEPAAGWKVAIGGHRVCGLVVEPAAGWRVAIGGHRVGGLMWLRLRRGKLSLQTAWT